jgi:7-keto-8-aminopelargonate synthetase-like enzyme
MNTEPHKMEHGPGELPRHADVSYEERDVKAGTIYGYLFALGAAVLASLVICVYVLRLTTNFAASSDTPPPPSRKALGPNYRELPPEPRLQGIPGHEKDPQQDLRDKLKADTEANEKFEWIDKNAGIAQIPVEDAMKIIAEKGLPAAPAPPAKRKQ